MSAAGHSAGLHNQRAHNLFACRRRLRRLTGPGGLDAYGCAYRRVVFVRRDVCQRGRGALAETAAARRRSGHSDPGRFRPASPATRISDPAPALQDQARFLLFANTDLWRQGGFAHGGVLWAPQRARPRGPGAQADVRRRRLSLPLRRARQCRCARRTARRRGPARLAFRPRRLDRHRFLGFDFQQHRLTPDDPSAGLRGDYVGARTGFELWYQPIGGDDDRGRRVLVHGRAELQRRGLPTGLRVLDAFYLGPEIQAFGADSNYRQFRAGLHITGLRTGGFEWSAGAGWATDTDDRSGAYGKLGVFTRLLNPACGGSASPRSSSRPASGRPAPARRSAGRRASSP